MPLPFCVSLDTIVRMWAKSGCRKLTTSNPSVIRIRLQGLDGLALAKLVQKVLAGFECELERGSLVTVKANKTSCHGLPVRGTG